MEWSKELLELFDDPLLKDVKPKPAAITADDRIQRKINELREWIEHNGREPDSKGSMQERLLAVSLRTYKEKGLWI